MAGRKDTRHTYWPIQRAIRMKSIRVLICIVVVSGLCLAEKSRAATREKTNQSFEADVLEVPNGHSLTVLLGKASVKVRLWGIVSPKKGSAFGRQARSILEQLCLGKKVLVRPKFIERSGLVAAKVRVGTHGWLHEILVSEGLVWWKEEEAPGAEKLKILQGQAQRAKKGIWSRPDSRPPPEGKKKETQAKKERLRVGKKKIKNSVAEPRGDSSSTVVITAKGRNYHQVKCRKIKGTSYRITLLKARESYKPCPVCKPPS